MRNLFLIVFSFAVLCTGCNSDNHPEPQEEPPVTLYDINKEAIAYIDLEDDATIYTFEGEPVAYIELRDQVYGFNGSLLGWYSDGVLYDRTCYAVGARQGIARGGINTVATRPEKIKGAKHVKPVKQVKENAGEHPVLFDSWSETTLSGFFTAGKK